MNQNNYEPNKTLSVFLALGFRRFPELDNDYVYYLYHKAMEKEVFVDKTDDVDDDLLKYQLNDIGLNKILFDSLYENLK